MNSKRLGQLRISPLHIQQGLFASLALLITLIVVQQFQQWDNARQAAQVSQVQTLQRFNHHPSFSAVRAPMVKDTASSLVTVDGSQATGEMPQRQTWVF